MQLEWTQKPGRPEDTWIAEIPGGHGYIAEYSPGSDYNWQAWRGAGSISGSAPDRDAAMAAAEAGLAMPIDEFNVLAAASVREDMQRIEKKLIAITGSSDGLPGYAAGFEAGFAAARKKIEEAFA